MTKPRRPITPTDLAYLHHLTTHITTHIESVLARHGDATPIKDGMRSPAPGSGSRPAGTHSDPTINAALTRTDHADPAVILTEALKHGKAGLDHVRMMVTCMILLGADKPMELPRCTGCAKQRTLDPKGRCESCARVERRRAAKVVAA